MAVFLHLMLLNENSAFALYIHTGYFVSNCLSKLIIYGL